METYKIFGPPGTGKTTFLLDVVENEIEETETTRIGYFAFTRKASQEARDRAMQRFPGLSDKELPWFRTLHSTAYRSLQLSSKEMMKHSDYQEFASRHGLSIQTETEEDWVVRTDHPILNQINLARIRGVDLWTHYNQSRINLPWHHVDYLDKNYTALSKVRICTTLQTCSNWCFLSPTVCHASKC